MNHNLSNLLNAGCDERILLKPDTGTNKYHLNPLRYQGLLQRGSCTCNPLTPDGHRLALEFVQRMPEMQYRRLMSEQTRRLQNLLKLGDDDEFHVVYCPSGSDAMYVPLMFQQSLFPAKPIINIVSCPEELGSGSILAAQAKYYASRNQFGERVQIHDGIEGASRVDTHFLAARDKDGFILDRKAAIRELVAQHEGSPIIGNLVFGSKSGIKDDLAIIDEFPSEVMWVVDMCQFRADVGLIHELLQKGVLLMVTGSKFFQAPPFCGALLLPKSWTRRIAAGEGAPAEAYARLFTRWDFPPALKNIRNRLSSFENWGLRLRWAIAIDEMEAYRHIPKEVSDAWIRRWNRIVVGRLAISGIFGMMPDMELTNDSIISFNVRVGNRTLYKRELKELFDVLVTSTHEGLGDCDRFFMGQPVDYGVNAFIRLAVGSHTVRKAVDAENFDFGPDLRIVDLIENHAKSMFA